MITLESLKEDFRNIGIKVGDTLFLRISYKSVGEVEGGPMTFLKALHEVVGEEGTIILTAFPKKHISQLRFFHRREVYSEEKPPRSTTGIMSVMATSYPGALLSRKLEFPFVVIGKHANYLTQMHTHEKRGYGLLEEAIEKFNGTLIFISHDRYFINKFADKTIELENGNIETYFGGYDFYKEEKQKRLKNKDK